MQELVEKYGTIGAATVGGQEIPIINIPMMSDERWQQLAEESIVHNFTIHNNRKPESINEAKLWYRSFIAELEKAI